MWKGTLSPIRGEKEKKMTIKYTVHKHGYSFDDNGREIEYDHNVEKEAIAVYYKPHCYSDSIHAYYAAECTCEEAESVAEAFNKEYNVHPYAPRMTIEEVPFGMMFIITEPYDD